LKRGGKGGLAKQREREKSFFELGGRPSEARREGKGMKKSILWERKRKGNSSRSKNWGKEKQLSLIKRKGARRHELFDLEKRN